MPIFDYKCEKCELEFEIFFKPGERVKDKVVCPNCGGKSRKVISKRVGVKFKGSGFYETDYKRKETGMRTKGKTTTITKPSSSADKTNSGDSNSD